MTTLRCLGNTVMMKFVDSTGGHKGQFSGTAGYGIQIVASADEQKKARWAEVVAVGPKADGIEVGDFVMVEALMWMEGNVVDGVKLNKTDVTKILAVSNDKADCQYQ